ncbi:MAG: hypothetical protein GY696_21220 [Gammaproteobacteria bacterium]|nr:hypothetical protein [Gammaproteobacteria bacterium]
MLKPVSGYSLEYYDCGYPTKVNKFARPTVCDPLAAEEEVATGSTFEVLTQAAVREVPGWSCDVTQHLDYRGLQRDGQAQALHP